ncbi:MAG: FprA family A-type flavoprotein [Candidatus Omnitrophota bacterium]
MKIKDGVYWTGYIDWNLRVFHGYGTPFGSTYNAYLLMDEKPTLIDTVKHYGFDEMLSRIKDIIDPAKIKYIISNHTEMDHSGTIDQLLAYCPEAQVVCSPKGAEELKRHFKKDWKFKVVNTGDTLDIGQRKLQFFLMPMVHWPDSMATYSAHDQILFSNDAFGQHYASDVRYADEVGCDIVFQEAAKYYANIVLPYGAQTLKALEALSLLKIDMICSSHGLIWRRKKDMEKIISLYKKWASHQTDRRVTIIYDTMWHSTEIIANHIYRLIDQAGISVKLINLQMTEAADILTDILFSKVVIFGTPILNNRMLPTMGGLLMYLKGLKPKNRYALTFGSYGWSTVGFKEFEESLREAGFELLGEGKYLQFIPDQKELDELSSVVPLIQNQLKMK